MAYRILKSASARPVKGVLFDMDGVVLDTETLYTRFWMEAANAYGYPMTFEQSLGLRSLNRDRGEKYLEKCFGEKVDYPKLRLERIKRMNAWIDEHGVDPKPGINELLSFLHKNNIPCAITTSSPQERIKNHLTPLGLYDKFDAVCSGYEVKHGKPEPDIYLYGAKTLGLPPADCLALEDSPAGIESAFRAGTMAVVIPDKDQPSEKTLSESFAKADCLTDICELIEELNR